VEGKEGLFLILQK